MEIPLYDGSWLNAPRKSIVLGARRAGMATPSASDQADLLKDKVFLRDKKHCGDGA
jgi:hypothetical protein